MKLVNKTLALLSLASFGFLGLEAKSIDFLLDHQAKETFHLQTDVPSPRLEQPFTQPSLLSYYQQLTIENQGDQLIQGFFPYINRPPCFSLEDLANRLNP